MKLDDQIPLFLQIERELKDQIISGALKEEEAIPSIRVMAKEYRINPNTVSRAVTDLVNEGILFKKRGIGLFVSKGALLKLRNSAIEHFNNIEFKNCVNHGKKLGISKEEMINRLEKIYNLSEE